MKTKNPISVFLVDDSGIYLKSLSRFLNAHFNYKIQIESFTTGKDCLREIEKNPTVEVVILDYYLNTGSPDALDGPDVLKKIKDINPDIIVIMLSSEDKMEIAMNCIALGAYEYVVKSETAFIRIQNILKNLIHQVGIQSFYPVDIGGEA